MSIFPAINPALEAQLNKANQINTQTSKTMGKSFLFDFSKGDFAIKDGKVIETTNIEALKVWIEKVIRTEKFKFKIYKKENVRLEYGITIMDLVVGKKYPEAYVQEEIKREIAEALLKNNLIKSVSDWSLIKDKRTLNISFTVKSTLGTFDQVVIY